MAGATPKSKDAKAKGKGKAPAAVPAPPKAAVEPDAESSESDEEDDGVDEEGMQRLLAALGDDGLDEYDQAQLAALGGDEDDEEAEDDEDDDASSSGPGNLEALDDSDDDDEEEDDEDVALDEIPSGDEDVDMDMDIVPMQKVTVDDKAALDRIHALIKLDASMPWTETLAVTYDQSIDVDVDNDLERELAFYKQALHGAQTARALAKKHNFAWSRPTDYFAEMVKSDAHMERVRQKLLDENAGIKRSEEKRREREGKKFGKQVQQEKLRERAQARKDLDEKIKGLKRKRKGALDDNEDGGGGAEDFDVALDDDRPSKRPKSAGRPGLSRAKRDSKFGFGSGGGRRSKQNTRDSTDDFHGSGSRGKGAGGRGGFKAGGARGGSKRLGKSRRQNAKSKK